MEELYEFLDFQKKIIASFIGTYEEALEVHYQVNLTAKDYHDVVCTIVSQEI